MYAVIKTGGKQYRVESGDVITVERLDGEVGGTLDFGDVFMIGGEGVDNGVKIGTPKVDGALVRAEVLDQTRGPKVLVFKKRRRKKSRRMRGHRQFQTVLRIRDIAVA